ncbi:MAG: peptidoglycan-binding protein [Firmicutes bacterium]|nr:peptidoglycan-binding protein [Bacillota bacterium]
MTIVKGENGSKVYALQYALHILNYNTGEIDGSFGDATESAVKLFQSEHGLTQTGHINGGTWLSITAQIKAIQQALSERGFYDGYADGIASEITYNAVISFQNANNLVADGIIGPATTHYLYGYDGTVNTASFPLGEGDIGELVQNLQHGLHILWCHPGSIDGKFGPATTTAVKEFQTRYALTVDGYVGTATWGKMTELINEIQTALQTAGFYAAKIDGIPNNTTYRALVEFQRANNLDDDAQIGPLTSMALLGTTSAGGSDDLPLSTGSSGKKVLYLQYALTILCIDPNGFDGNFGPGTESAVREYQTESGLAVTGIVDVETWMSISDKISIIQQALVNHGYDTGGVDGVAGDGTYSAVLAFQTDNGLDADGMVGPYTRELLNAPADATVIGTTSSTLSLGSNGSLTRYLKYVLTVLGYNLTVDGNFDEATHNAVVDFQTVNNLEADGIVGSGTWNLLKTLYRVPVEGLGIDKLVNVAKHEADLSFKEDNSNNITPYGQWYGMNGEPWCAMFVSWCAYQAGLLETTIPSFAYCPYGVNEYIAKDRYYSAASRYIPRVGDVVFFIDSTDDTASHTGIIVEVSETGIKTVEGNTQDEVGYRNYEFGDPYILGYGCNEHAEFTDPPEPTEFEKNNAVARKAGTILERLGFENIVSASNIILAIGGSIPISPTKTAHSFYMGDNVILTVAFKRGIDIHTDTNLPFEYSQSLDWNDLFAGDPSFDTDVSMAFDRLNISTALGQEYFNKFNFAVELDNFEIDITAYFDNQKTPHIRFTFSYQEEVEVTPYFSDVLSGEIILDISYPLGHEYHFEMVNLVNTLLDRQIDTFESLAVKLALTTGAVIATLVALSLCIFFAAPYLPVLKNLILGSGTTIIVPITS